MTPRFLKSAVVLFALIAVGSASLPQACGCTRCVYLGPNGTVITARSMDWAEDIRSNMWAFPRGMKRDGATGPNTLKWVSKYGSVIVSGYDVGTADGMNEKGLVANVLYLAESDYGKPDPNSTTISIGAWAQYVLDTCATVAEAVDLHSKTPLVVVAPILPNGVPASLHLSVSDPSGDSAVFEYVGGKLVVHHGRQYQVMTNSPIFDQQLAIEKYWEQVGGTVFLPGTNRAADRFARASFFINAIPRTDNTADALASVFGVIRGVSVPLGLSTPGQPNISSTRWRTVADHKSRTYYFDNAISPSVFWVDLSDVEFKEGTPVKKLTISGGQPYAGNAAGKFVPAVPFEFLGTK